MKEDMDQKIKERYENFLNPAVRRRNSLPLTMRSMVGEVLKSAGTTPYANAQCMAVRKDWAILAGILQKALDSISETERLEIYRRWVPIRYDLTHDIQ
jgi:hypothetical protein